jgi:hypothetical protein
VKRARFVQAARAEFTASRLWYAVRSVDVARAFTNAIAHAIDQIREHQLDG